ncbi:kynurenine 3-monooxygenase [Tenebrio molitor]|uniref:kynurenine 3-monooxygenase n=1 Tax=Tenebrio molitor TaxID=7067 RepID=UPI0036246C91
MASNNIKTVIVIGGGLVGSLCGIFMAKRGYHVTIFEYREDVRSARVVHGRSINMALSNRGRRALAAVGLEDLILESAIPMKGRMLHDLEGRTKSVPYDARSGQCIYSINRNYLNKVLLTELESYPNVKLYFGYKLISVNFDEETIAVLNVKTQKLETHQSDLIIGADGAFSTLRRFMQLTPLFEFSQTYIKHGYLELTVPPQRGLQMTPNHLHIWPRGQFMMIALPNQDNSWTVTLFMPFTNFTSLKNEKQLIRFFQRVFPDSVSLLGEDLLARDFFKVKPSPLVSLKCNPYHVGTKFLIVGDAAHAMVPFYGQGMNAGFEDCLILNSILDQNKDDVGSTVHEFTARRVEDAHAICDLAMYNYVEMRDLVTRRSYHLRKLFDEVLFKLLPNMWIPLYNSVTFSGIGYKECVANRQWQDRTIERLFWSIVLILAVVLAYVYSLWWR